ncbi:MAG: flavin reductase [Clostridia bacterium]|nr:flavin reductase [Clostridia bacterium]
MKKNIGAKAMLYPMPVLIIGSYDENYIPDAMNAAWGGISEEKEISICVSPEHKTTENILKRSAFTVSCADAKNVVEADFVGLVSANDMPDKIEKCGWNAVKSNNVDAPLFDELPFTLECKLISYDEESCRLVGEIVNIAVDEEILNNGRIDLTKFKPIVYDSSNHNYLTLGEAVGKAFSDGKKIK